MTRLGFHLTLVGTFAMVGGALRGLNLLLILAALAVGTLLMHWRWSRRSIQRLSARRKLPRHATMGIPFRIHYEVENHSRWSPVWLLRVQDRVSMAELPGGPRRLSTLIGCGIGSIPAGTSRWAHLDCTLNRRGAYAFGPSRLASSFPFSLVEGQKYVGTAEVFHVYPKLLQLRPGWRKQLTRSGSQRTGSTRNSGGQTGEFSGIRNWQSADSTKWIHWRTTARTGSIAVKQFEESQHLEMCLVLDAFAGNQSVAALARQPSTPLDRLRRVLLGTDDPSCPNQVAPLEPGFETAVGLTATFLFRSQQLASARVVLAVASVAAWTAKVGRTRDISAPGASSLMRVLSEVRPCVQPRLRETLIQLSKAQNRPKQIVVVSTRSMRQAADADADLSGRLPRLSRFGGLRWINVNSSDIDPFVADRRGTA